MELKLTVAFEDLLQLIQQLPEEQLELLKEKLKHIEEPPSLAKSNQALKALIKKAPTMTDEQYADFLKSRESWNNWRGV